LPSQTSTIRQVSHSHRHLPKLPESGSRPPGRASMHCLPRHAAWRGCRQRTLLQPRTKFSHGPCWHNQTFLPTACDRREVSSKMDAPSGLPLRRAGRHSPLLPGRLFGVSRSDCHWPASREDPLFQLRQHCSRQPGEEHAERYAKQPRRPAFVDRCPGQPVQYLKSMPRNQNDHHSLEYSRQAKRQHKIINHLEPSF